MLEIIAIVGAAAYAIVNGVCKVEDKRLPRRTYSSLIGWWYGAFVNDTPAASIARLIDSDTECQAWTVPYDRWDGPVSRKLINETMKVTLTFRESTPDGLCRLYIEDKQQIDMNTNTKVKGKDISIPIGPQDDYLLWGAYNRWVKRSQKKSLRDQSNNIDNLLTQRINENYNLLIERFESDIARTRHLLEDQSELKASLPVPPMKTNVYLTDSTR